MGSFKACNVMFSCAWYIYAPATPALIYALTAQLFRHVPAGISSRVGGGGRQSIFIFQLRVSYDHSHITIYLPTGKTNCVCSPNSMIIKNNSILTSLRVDYFVFRPVTIREP